MKKRIIKISAIALLSVVSVSTINSCRDAIDIVQDGEVNDNLFYTSVANMDAYLKGGVYMNYEPASAIYATSVLTDEVKPGSGSGGQQYDLHRYYITSADGLVSSTWISNYRVINNCNRLIEGSKKVTPSSSELASYNQILAEARVLRALSYLQLQTYFSENMQDDNALGVIIVDGVPTADTKKQRSINKDVYNLINSDLDYAEQYLPQSSRYYASKNLVSAIRARLNLYRGKYAEAKAAALEVLSKSGLSLTNALPASGLGSLVAGSTEWNTAFYKEPSFSPYRNIWNDTNQGEVIFAASRPVSGSGTNLAASYNLNQSNLSGTPMWAMGRNLFNILDKTEGDIRRYTYVDPTSKIDPNYATSSSPIQSDQLIIDKYPGKSTAPLRNDVKVFRLSEMYFILAECAVAENDFALAKSYIQKVRESRNYLGKAITPTYTSSTQALADILKERRVELAFEGHRYIDLKRLAAKAGVTMDRNATDDIVPVSNLENGSYKYTFPIPMSEIAGNPNIQQNSGYAN
ncbi:RagB/SusD family nutrient uptake outer membrane protein [Riemerella anatipestifer]|nr:RagB/SusD family nutrient uptake outer membrane protein [Riemerella anatipestifer]